MCAHLCIVVGVFFVSWFRRSMLVYIGLNKNIKKTRPISWAFFSPLFFLSIHRRNTLAVHMLNNISKIIIIIFSNFFCFVFEWIVTHVKNTNWRRLLGALKRTCLLFNVECKLTNKNKIFLFTFRIKQMLFTGPILE